MYNCITVWQFEDLLCFVFQWLFLLMIIDLHFICFVAINIAKANDQLLQVELLEQNGGLLGSTQSDV